MIKAKSSIIHNGKMFAAGDILPSDMSSKEQQQLIDSGVAEFTKEATPKAAPKPRAKVAAKPSKSKSASKREATQKETVDNSKPNRNWGKTRLIGEGRRRGLKLDETMMPDEMVAAILAAPELPPDDSQADDTPAVTRTSVQSEDVPPVVG